jgi:predicted amidohydrolase YtcJ
MVHAIGDGAVRMTLDGFERLPKANPTPARGRNRVEHIETIDLADVPRFAKLGVIASMHPGGGFLQAQSRYHSARICPGSVGPESRFGAHGQRFHVESISDASGSA